MNTDDLEAVLDVLCAEELRSYDLCGEHRPSLGHRIRMRRLFRRAVRDRCDFTPVGRKRMTLRRLVTAAAIILFAAALALGASVTMPVRYGNIYGVNMPGYIHLTTLYGDYHTVIDEEYELSRVPEGYRLTERLGKAGAASSVIKTYRNGTGDFFTFYQRTRGNYHNNIDNERTVIKSLSLEQGELICIGLREDAELYNIVILDAQKYILEISGNIDEEEAIDLVISAEISRN